MDNAISHLMNLNDSPWTAQTSKPRGVTVSVEFSSHSDLRIVVLPALSRRRSLGSEKGKIQNSVFIIRATDLSEQAKQIHLRKRERFVNFEQALNVSFSVSEV
jgi:hypothetical protein